MAFDRELIHHAIAGAAPELSKTATEGHELAAIGPAGPSGIGAPGVSPISNGVALLTVVVKSYDERLSTDELLRKYAAELDHKLREVDSRRAVDELLQAKLRDRFKKLSAQLERQEGRAS